MVAAEDTGAAVVQAAQAARDVLAHNLHGACGGLPRTAAWGYPEPYTRDLLLSSLAALVTQDAELMESLRCRLYSLLSTHSGKD